MIAEHVAHDNNPQYGNATGIDAAGITLYPRLSMSRSGLGDLSITKHIPGRRKKRPKI
jgi:hypothetical protein